MLQLRNLITLKGRIPFRLLFLFLVLALTLACNREAEDKPTLFIVGVSTVKCGRGDGGDGLWGWGNFLHEHLDTTKIIVENHAIGGRSSRSFQTEGRWDKILARMSPGDFVLIQMGHNDGGSLNTGRARGTLRGSGEETEEVIMERDSSLEGAKLNALSVIEGLQAIEGCPLNNYTLNTK